MLNILNLGYHKLSFMTYLVSMQRQPKPEKQTVGDKLGPDGQCAHTLVCSGCHEPSTADGAASTAHLLPFAEAAEAETKAPADSLPGQGLYPVCREPPSLSVLTRLRESDLSSSS